MSNPGGHCRHCAEDCRGTLGGGPDHAPIPPYWHAADYDRASWDTGACPACAEAERIALAIHERGLPLGALDTFEAADILNRSAAIARGEA